MRRLEVLCALVAVGAALVAVLGSDTIPTPGGEDFLTTLGYFGVPALAATVYARAWYGVMRDDSRRHVPWVLFAMPVGVAVTALPRVVSTGLGDAPNPWSDTVMWVMLVTVIVATGMLAGIAVLLPVELFGRGIVRLVTGRAQGGRLLFWSMVAALCLVLVAIGPFALRDLPPGRVGGGAVVAAMLGVPGAYTVVSAPMLWAARCLVVLILALLLAASRLDPRQRAARAQAVRATGRRDAAARNARQHRRERRQKRTRGRRR